MIKELIEIRKKLMDGVENKDLLYIKMQINNLDTLIYNQTNRIKVFVDNLPKKKTRICGNCKYFVLWGVSLGLCTRTERTKDHLSYSRGCKYFEKTKA